LSKNNGEVQSDSSEYFKAQMRFKSSNGDLPNRPVNIQENKLRNTESQVSRKMEGIESKNPNSSRKN